MSHSTVFVGAPLSILTGFLILAAVLAAMMGTYLDYFVGPQSNQALYRFVQFEKTPAEFRKGLLIALACAIGASWIGLARGDWLRRVRR